jgi:hypothetical protein
MAARLVEKRWISTVIILWDTRLAHVSWRRGRRGCCMIENALVCILYAIVKVRWFVEWVKTRVILSVRR